MRRHRYYQPPGLSKFRVLRDGKTYHYLTIKWLLSSNRSLLSASMVQIEQIVSNSSCPCKLKLPSAFEPWLSFQKAINEILIHDNMFLVTGQDTNFTCLLIADVGYYEATTRSR